MICVSYLNFAWPFLVDSEGRLRVGVELALGYLEDANQSCSACIWALYYSPFRTQLALEI